MKILLVEDLPYVRVGIVNMLRRAGHEVEAAADGDEALRAYRNRLTPYDLVLTDRLHPGLEGIELAAKIRQMSPSQRIAFQTSGITASIERRIRRYGVSDIPCIRKPFRPAQLLAFIQSVGGKLHKVNE
jgi:CheY-like chemotaxis protein